MPDLNIPYEKLTMIVFVGLLTSVIFFSDLVAVIIIVGTVAGLAIGWMNRRYTSQNDNWRNERRNWEEGQRWW
jgi:hypothetical protein